MYNLFVLLLFLRCAVALPTTAETQVGPNAKANSLTYTGNGCPQGSVAFVINESNTVTGLEAMQPSMGPGTTVKDQKKECTVTLDMSVDAGWKYRVNGLNTTFKGVMPLDKGWTLTFQAKYAFKNSAAQVHSFSVL